MRRLNLWMLTAVLAIGGIIMTSLTACSSNNDNTNQDKLMKKKLVGEWICEIPLDGYTTAVIYHFSDDGFCWKEVDVMQDGKLVAQPVDRYTTSQSTFTIDAGGRIDIALQENGEASEEGDELLFDGTKLTYENAGEQVSLLRATNEQVERYREESDAWHGGAADTSYDVADYKPKGVDNSLWMKALDDSRLVADLSLPGSHDACTAEGWWNKFMAAIYESMAKCQDLTIDEQLKVGVRVFDLRPETVAENGKLVLRCSHGYAATNMYVSDFFKTLKQWLAAHPSEFCIVTADLSVTNDKTGWGRLFNDIVSGTEYKSMFADFKSRLTVGEMRGKVLLLSKWEYAEKPIGGYCVGWGYDQELEKQQKGHITAADGSETPLWVQDYWQKITRVGKDQALVRMLEAAVGRDMTVEKPVWVINYPSAYIYGPFSDYYRENAVSANKVTIDWLSGHTGSVGIIYMDFCGMDKSPATAKSKLYETLGMKLVDSVIKQNWK